MSRRRAIWCYAAAQCSAPAAHASPLPARAPGRDAPPCAPPEAPPDARRRGSHASAQRRAIPRWSHAAAAAAIVAAPRLHDNLLLWALLAALLASAALPRWRACATMKPMRHAASRASLARCGGCRRGAFAAALAAACVTLLATPACGQSVVSCDVNSWMYVGGFTGTSATLLNGYYAPYFSATAAPTTLQGCTNSGYDSFAGTGTNWAAAFNASWQAGAGSTRPVGYYNMRSSVSDVANTFWVRDYDTKFLAPTQSFWNLVTGSADCLAVSTNYYIYMSNTSGVISGECASPARRKLSCAAVQLTLAPSRQFLGRLLTQKLA